MIPGIIALVVVAVLAFVVFGMYNSLISLRNKVTEGWAQIDVQLTRRADLIPNLVNTVKGYASHEKGVFEAVTQARANMVNTKEAKNPDPAAVAEADSALEGTLKSLFAVSENYPTLRASENFMQLQEELTSTENRVTFARQYYNDIVRQFNTKIQSVPTNIVAKFGSFPMSEYFNAPESAQAVPIVEF